MKVKKNMYVPQGILINAENPGENGALELCVALTGEWLSREMVVKDEQMQQMLANFQKEGRDLLFDFDHKSLWDTSQAAGWGKSMELREGKLYVKMQPTEAGAAAINSGEYKYLSPVYEYMRYDRVTGKKLKDWRLHSVALTNVPFLTELPAIKNSEGETMEELLKLLGATDEDTAIAKAKELMDANAAKDEKITTLETELTAANAKLSENQAKINSSEVDKAIQDKKLLPAQKELAVKLINSDRKLYEDLLASTPPQDLGKPVDIAKNDDDSLDKFAKVQSFRDLLKDDELYKAMKAEDPERFNALFKKLEKEGK